MVTSLFTLKDQVALVIGGAAGGLGEAAVRALCDAGATIAIADLAGRTADVAVVAESVGATAHAVDVADEASVRALFKEVLDRHDHIDVVVNAAGVMLRKTYHETTVEEFERVVRVNLTGTWLVGREAGKAMSRSGGRIVNFTSVYAERVGPLPETAYYASKAGILNVTRALAQELGPQGVRVNCLAPGVFYPTRMTGALDEQPDQLQWFADRTMLGRLGDPAKDFAGPLMLLATEASSYMTGQILYIDGGWSAW